MESVKIPCGKCGERFGVTKDKLTLDWESMAWHGVVVCPQCGYGGFIMITAEAFDWEGR